MTSESKKSEQPTSCQICWENFNKSNRKAVCCPYDDCGLTACRICVKYYLTSKTSLAHCMGCNKPWNREFMQKNLTNSYFKGEWKDHRKGLLFETEKARFPETMPKVEQEIKIRKLNVELSKAKQELEEIRQEYEKRNMRVIKIQRQIGNIKYYGIQKEKKAFIKKCPGDNCNGFLSSGYKCAVCDARVCSKCHVIMGYNSECKNDHECDPDTVAAVELIKQETKPCPQCGVPIFKISGCDQMWCTQCNIAFSWRTGLKVNGVIHNPHYYEYMRQNGGENAVQNPGAVRCGGIPTYRALANIIRIVMGVFGEQYKMKDQYLINNVKKTQSIHRGAQHFQHTVLVPIRRNIQQNRDNEDLSIKFIMKEVDEKQLKTTLLKRDNAFEKKQTMLHIYELMGNVYVESTIALHNMFLEIYNNRHQDNIHNLLQTTYYDNFNRLILNLENVRKYCNKELTKVSLVYNQVVEIIDDYYYTSVIKKEESKKAIDQNNFNFTCVINKNLNRPYIKRTGKSYRSNRNHYLELDGEIV